MSVPTRVLVLLLVTLLLVAAVQVIWVTRTEASPTPESSSALVDAAPAAPMAVPVAGPAPDAGAAPDRNARDSWSTRLSPQRVSPPRPSAKSRDNLRDRSTSARSVSVHAGREGTASRSPHRDAAATETRGDRVGECSNPLVRLLYRVGFRGPNVREAWAIAMRESRGQARLGPGHPQYNGSDVGLFQWNRPSWSNAEWWDEKKLLNGHYNASIAYTMSKGGRTWGPWGLTGSGELDASRYVSVWSAWQIQAWIWEPFQRFSREFADLPAACRDLASK